MAVAIAANCTMARAEVAPLSAPNLSFGAGYSFGDFVNAIAPLPDGGFLIGGTFRQINGVPRFGIARLNADGSLDRGWNAALDTNQYPRVNAIVVVGNDAYVGGFFTQMGGQPRVMLARIALSDGSAVPGWRADVDQQVLALTTDGTDLIVGGNMFEVGGVARRGLAKVSLATGAVSPWTNDLSDVEVDALAVEGDSLYVASYGALYRVSLSSSNSRDPSWGIAIGGGDNCCYYGLDMKLAGAFVYIGGIFTQLGGVSHPYLARVSKAPGSTVDPTWTPTPDKPVYKIFADQAGVVIAGEFKSVNGLPRISLAEVDLATGATTSWNPGRAPNQGSALASAGGFVYAGFISGWSNIVQSSVLKVPRASGVADPTFRLFASRSGGSVRSIALALDGRTYIAGTFMGVNGFPINGLARLNADGSLDENWHPDPDGHAYCVALAGDGLIAGGSFSRLGGTDRNLLAKISTGTSAVVDPLWNPDVRATPGGLASVNFLAVDGGGLFLSGAFDQVSGMARNRIAKVAIAGTGAVDSTWDANWTGAVDIRALAAGGGGVYAGGFFTAANTGQANLVKLSGSSGARDGAWNPAADGGVVDLLFDATQLYAGGEFHSIGGIVQGNLARIDASTGAADGAWRPVAQDAVSSMTAANGVLYTAYLERFPAAPANAAFSTATGKRDLSWLFTPTLVNDLRSRPGQVWAGLDMFSTARQGVAAFPEAFCASQPDGTTCDAGPSNPAMCQANVCVRAVAARYEFNSDSHPDIVFRNAGSGSTFVWHMNGPALVSDQYVTTIDPSWSLVGHGDFDGDGKNDMVWRNDAAGTAYVWYMKDGVFQSDAFLFTIDPVWKIEAVADFNNDGKPDFLFRHQSTGVGFIWYFNNTTPVSDQFLFSIDNSWIVENVGDFNNDGYPDFFFRNTSSGVGFVWYWNGTALGGSNFLFGIDPVWQVVEIADWNGDGKVDLLFRNAATGVIFVWYTNGTSLQGSDFLFQIDPSWKIVPYR